MIKMFHICLLISTLCFILFVSCRKAEKPSSWGIYQILWNKNQYLGNLDTSLAQLGGKPEYVMFFRDLVRRYPRDIIRENKKRSLTTIITIEPVIWGRRNDSDYLSRIHKGHFDMHFRSWFSQAVQDGTEIIYRFGFEMNGDWFSWGQRPDDFIKAWRHVHDIAQKEEATHVKWMFSPNVMWNKDDKLIDIRLYYPGDLYTDYVGLDGYNFGDHHDKDHTWQTPKDIFHASYQIIRHYQKPVFIAETGCPDDPRKADWIRDFLNYYESNNYHAFIWFNYNKQNINWPISSNPDSLAVFRTWTDKQYTATGSL